MAFGESSGFERTEQPTAKRQEDARRRGQVARSTDLTTALLLLGSLGALATAGGPFVVGAVGILQETLGHLPAGDLASDLAVHGAADPAVHGASDPAVHGAADSSLALLARTTLGLARRSWPFVVIPAVTAIAAQMVQTRMVLSWQALGPHWSRLNPAQGLARLLSGHGLVETLRTVIKVVLLAGIVYAVFRADWPALLVLGPGGTNEAIGTVGTVVRNLWLAVGLSYLAIAGLDYGYQLWHHQKSLRMTREEVREESREQEGNPLLRSRVRALQRQRATRRMMAEVKRADVVLRNPVHVAVALRYETGRMRAPRVVAKGARLVAARIVEAAREHGVPIVENPPLARALFRAVAIGQEIPRELYRTVAEVLAYVYSLKRPAR